MIEELEDIVEAIANDVGVYGVDKRPAFVSDLSRRIRDAVAVDSGGATRQRVALDIMLAWLGNPEVFWDDGEDSPDADYYTRMAQHAYVAADAFLARGAPGVASIENFEDTSQVGTKDFGGRSVPGGATRQKRKTK